LEAIDHQKAKKPGIPLIEAAKPLRFPLTRIEEFADGNIRAGWPSSAGSHRFRPGEDILF